MNFKNHSNRKSGRPLMICLVICQALSMTFIATNSNAFAPQKSDDEWVLQFGPNPEILKPDSIYMAIDSWKWKSQISKRQQELILKSSEKWQVAIRSAQEQREHLQNHLAKMGLPKSIDANFASSIEREIRDVSGQLAAIDATRADVANQNKFSRRELELQMESFLGETKLMKEKLNVLEQAYDQNRSFEASEDSEADARAANQRSSMLRLEILDLHAAIESKSGQIRLIESRIVDANSSKLKDVSQRKADLVSRLDQLSQKKKVLEEKNPFVEFEKLDQQNAIARKMIELATERQYELELENTQYLALIELAEERMAEYERKMEFENDGSEKEDDEDPREPVDDQ